MNEVDYNKLRDDVVARMLLGNQRVGVLGLTPTAVRLVADLTHRGLRSRIVGIYAASIPGDASVGDGVPRKDMSELSSDACTLLVVADDAGKEDLLRLAVAHLRDAPDVCIGGFGHFQFRDRVFEELLGNLLVPSLANGYPNTLIHLYQCLQNAGRLNLEGSVAEFGMFKGGTTMFLSRVIEHLGKKWKVFGFDTFGGFPPRRSILDMYAHPDCVFTDLPHVRSYLADRNVEVVVGDVVQTCTRLKSEDLILTFMDTDNFTSANSALDIVQERTVVGGAIVFDHFTGTDRHLRTLGERMAGARLLDDPRYFHLHGDGVFVRQR